MTDLALIYNELNEALDNLYTQKHIMAIQKITTLLSTIKKMQIENNISTTLVDQKTLDLWTEGVRGWD